MAKPIYSLPLINGKATKQSHDKEVNRYGGAIYDAAVVAQLGSPEAAALVAEFEGLRDDTVGAADRAEAAAERLSNGVAVILWTGQSNAAQPFDNSGNPDPIDSRVKIMNAARTGFVTLAAGQGGISGDATNHSLFNLTRLMLGEGEYEEVYVILSAQGGRPISDWVGTNSNRAITEANTPRMWDIRQALLAARTALGNPGLQFTHVFMIQGEEDSDRQMLPATGDTYAADRLAFRSMLKAQGYAGDETKWIDGELLRRDVSAVTWQANQVISHLPTLGGEPSAVIPTSGFVGQDEGLSVTTGGVAVPYTLHFSAAENSLYGLRAFDAVKTLDGGKTIEPDTSWLDTVAPDGRIGFRPPNKELTGGATVLSSQWARGAVININDGTNDVTLLNDDLRTGFQPSAGAYISFLIKNGATLNLTTQRNMVLMTGALVTTITRKGGRGKNILTLYWDGYNWNIVEDIAAFTAVAVGGPYHEIRNGRLYIRGQTGIGRTAGSTASVSFGSTIPTLLDAPQGLIFASAGCVGYGLSGTGFTLHRLVAVDAAVTQIAIWEVTDLVLA